MTQLNEFSAQRLERQREQNQTSVNNEVERGRIVTEKVRSRNERDVASLTQRGDDQVQQTQDKYNNKLARTDEEFARDYNKKQESWESREKLLNNQYASRLSSAKQENEHQLRNQDNHFKSAYQKHEEANRESLDVLDRQYVKQLAETKKDFMVKNSNYAQREKDPFYKVTDRGSALSESHDFYYLRAYVPEHEKDNVKVSIQNDRAVVSGQRSFQDKLEDSDKIVSSSSYQTFREDFAFDTPVMAKGMTRERNGDWVEFKIPKLSNGPRFSRKA